MLKLGKKIDSMAIFERYIHQPLVKLFDRGFFVPWFLMIKHMYVRALLAPGIALALAISLGALPSYRNRKPVIKGLGLKKYCACVIFPNSPKKSRCFFLVFFNTSCH